MYKLCIINSRPLFYISVIPSIDHKDVVITYITRYHHSLISLMLMWPKEHSLSPLSTEISLRLIFLKRSLSKWVRVGSSMGTEKIRYNLREMIPCVQMYKKIIFFLCYTRFWYSQIPEQSRTSMHRQFASISLVPVWRRQTTFKVLFEEVYRIRAVLYDTAAILNFYKSKRNWKSNIIYSYISELNCCISVDIHNIYSILTI